MLPPPTTLQVQITLHIPPAYAAFFQFSSFGRTVMKSLCCSTMLLRPKEEFKTKTITQVGYRCVLQTLCDERGSKIGMSSVYVDTNKFSLPEPRCHLELIVGNGERLSQPRPLLQGEIPIVHLDIGIALQRGTPRETKHVCTVDA